MTMMMSDRITSPKLYTRWVTVEVKFNYCNLVTVNTEQQARLVLHALENSHVGLNFRIQQDSVTWRVLLTGPSDTREDQCRMVSQWARGFYAGLKAHCAL